MVYAIQTCVIKNLGEEIVSSGVNLILTNQPDGQDDADSTLKTNDS